MKKLFKNDGGYKNHGRFLGWGSGPDADWRVLFSLFILGAVLVLVYSGLNFWRAWQGGFGAEIIDKTEAPLSEEKLKTITDFYKQKQADFDAVLKTPETTPDPSI